MQRATAEGLIDVTGLETTITILGGLGLFLLGMSVMTDGLKALTGTAFREWLSRAARTPVRGAATGLVVTLACQSSSVSTMTTIGLVGAGLMTFAQAVGVVLGANIGSTGTTWLIALAGGGFSLSRVRCRWCSSARCCGSSDAGCGRAAAARSRGWGFFSSG